MGNFGSMLGATDIFIGVVVILVCIPLVLEKVGPNRAYGFRLREAFGSDEAWYAINRYGAWQMIVWCAALIAFGLYVRDQGVEQGTTLYMVAKWSPLVLLLPCLLTKLYASRRY